MPASIPLVPIITDPEQWDRRTYNHILDRAINRQVPPEFWTAFRNWSQSRPHAAPNESWWKDFSPYNSKLIRWRLLGHGNMPSTIVGPNQNKYNVGRKLASWLDDYPAWASN